MKPFHPSIIIVSILLAASVNVLGLFLMKEYGDIRCLLVGIGLFLLVWVAIILERGASYVSIFDDETSLLSHLQDPENSEREDEEA